MAQSYYERHNGFYPPLADCTYDAGKGTYTIHLYEMVDDGGGYSHTATSAWYEVNSQGIGTDTLFGTAVNLSE